MGLENAKAPTSETVRLTIFTFTSHKKITNSKILNKYFSHSRVENNTGAFIQPGVGHIQQ